MHTLNYLGFQLYALKLVNIFNALLAQNVKHIYSDSALQSFLGGET